MSEEDSILAPSFRKKKSSSKQKEKPSSLRNSLFLSSSSTSSSSSKGLIEKNDDRNYNHEDNNNNNEDDEDDDLGNKVVSRKSSKRLNSSLRSQKSFIKKTNLSFGAADDSIDITDTSSINSPRRKLLRPQGLETPGSDQILPDTLSRPTSESSRPTYSASHLSELRLLNLSSPAPPKSHPREESFDSLTRSKFAQLEEDVEISLEGSEPSSSMLNIPTSSIINSAKEKRSQARKAGRSHPLKNSISASEDFISLSSTTTTSKSEVILSHPITKKGESRLVREEDEFGEGDDEHAEYTGAQERVPLGEKAGLRAEARKRAGMESMIIEAGTDLYEGNEEELEWEAEQIRRGGIGGYSERTTTGPEKKNYRAAPVPAHRNLKNLSSVTNRLSESLKILEDSVSEQEQNLADYAMSAKALEQQESDLRQEVSREIERETFFQELQSFIIDINHFFSAKWTDLERVEKDLLSILKERCQLIYKRRYEDLSDDLVLFKEGEVGITRPAKEEENETYKTENDKDQEDELMEEFDELGRSRREFDISSQAPSRRLRRDERIERRKRRRASLIKNPDVQEDEGYSTDDSLSPADSSDLFSASKSLISSSKEILGDTSNPLFLSPTNKNSLSDKFLNWKSRYPEDYDNAYGNLGLVQVWEFWARIEILMSGLNLWGIREWVKVDDRRGIENWDWMRGLESFDYQSKKNSMEEEEEDRSRKDSVIPDMIKEVIIPILIPIIKVSYDPFSTKSTTKSLELVEQIGYFLNEDEDEKFEELIQSFLERFQGFLFELKHLIANKNNKNSKNDDDDGKEFDLIEFKNSLKSQIGIEGIEARKRFLNRCFKIFKQGLRWKKVFKNKAFESRNENFKNVRVSLKNILVDGLVETVMLPVILIGWETGTKEIARKILESCPSNGFLSKDLIKTLQGGYET